MDRTRPERYGFPRGDGEIQERTVCIGDKIMDYSKMTKAQLIELIKQYEKGNYRGGGRKSRYTPLEFADMIHRFESGETYEQIAVRYKCTSAYIRKVIKKGQEEGR